MLTVPDGILRMTGQTGTPGIRGQAKLRPSLWQRITRSVIQDVPVENGLCEFDCPHTQCYTDHWQSCENRIRDVNLKPPTGAVVRAKPVIDWSSRIPAVLGAAFILLILGATVYTVTIYLLR
jgi:hypothetical protein